MLGRGIEKVRQCIKTVCSCLGGDVGPLFSRNHAVEITGTVASAAVASILQYFSPSTRESDAIKKENETISGVVGRHRLRSARSSRTLILLTHATACTKLCLALPCFTLLTEPCSIVDLLVRI